MLPGKSCQERVSHYEKAICCDRKTSHYPCTYSEKYRHNDKNSRKVWKNFGKKTTFASGDGNCLFNAKSVSLCGSQKLASELRVRTVVEMVVNADKYKHCKDAKTYLSLEPSYKDACVECGKNVWMMVVLASVIGRPIRSVYPPCNGTEGSIVFIYRSLNATFQTDKGSQAAQPIYIMWTSTIEFPKGLWSPNNFVPCLALTDVPGIPCKEDNSAPKQTEETNFSTSSQSYNQNFPDLSSSLEF